MAYLTTVGRVLPVGNLAYADDKFKGRRGVKKVTTYIMESIVELVLIKVFSSCLFSMTC